AASGRGEPCELLPERDRIVAGAPLYPAAVVVRDQRGQRHAVVMRGHGCETTAAYGCDASSLRLDSPTRLWIVAAGGQLFLSRADLDREPALACLGEHLGRIEPAADRGGEAEPVETACGEDDGVETPLAALAETCVDVAA